MGGLTLIGALQSKKPDGFFSSSQPDDCFGIRRAFGSSLPRPVRSRTQLRGLAPKVMITMKSLVSAGNIPRTSGKRHSP